MNNKYSANKTDKKGDASYSIYRVCTSGEPSIVIQSEGCCMVDCRGTLTKEAMRTVKSQVGEHVARSIINGRSHHFHVNMNGLAGIRNQLSYVSCVQGIMNVNKAKVVRQEKEYLTMEPEQQNVENADNDKQKNSEE